MSGWIGVDFDGTLAQYESGWAKKGLMGLPIPLMLARVKKWLAEGREVKILTARACHPEMVKDVEDWCEHYLGVILPVTNAKDFGMIELWDDRAIQVEFNTGRTIESFQRKAYIEGWKDCDGKSKRPDYPEVSVNKDWENSDTKKRMKQCS